MATSYKNIKDELTSLGFGKFYINSISNVFNEIDYGTKKGKIVSNSVIDAGNNYVYDASSEYQVSIDEPITIDKDIDDRDILLTCIEIFDWGGVQDSNILKAFSLHRNDKELKQYLINCKVWFENSGDLSEPIFDVVWSSGWTKVYSFMFDYVTIYDSRVAAFINYVCWSFYSSLGEIERKEFKSLSTGLLSFGGGTNRVRKLKKEDCKKLGLLSSPTDKRKMVANKQASWFLRYLMEVEGLSSTQKCFRTIDKAAFMLGFDLKQLNSPYKL